MWQTFSKLRPKDMRIGTRHVLRTKKKNSMIGTSRSLVPRSRNCTALTTTKTIAESGAGDATTRSTVMICRNSYQVVTTGLIMHFINMYKLRSRIEDVSNSEVNSAAHIQYIRNTILSALWFFEPCGRHHSKKKWKEWYKIVQQGISILQKFSTYFHAFLHAQFSAVIDIFLVLFFEFWCPRVALVKVRQTLPTDGSCRVEQILDKKRNTRMTKNAAEWRERAWREHKKKNGWNDGRPNLAH